jgi:hypothetical protein
MPVRTLALAALVISLVTVGEVLNVADAVPPGKIELLLPSSGTSSAGRILFEELAPAGVTKVEFRATGGGLRNTVVVTAKKHGKYLWLGYWNASAAHPGGYLIWSVDYTGAPGRRSRARSPTIKITIRS